MSKQPTPTTATSALVQALAALDNVKANKINPAFKAKYVSLDALLDAIKPVLLDHDLALIQTLVSEDGKVGVSTAFLHASGERFDFGKLTAVVFYVLVCHCLHRLNDCVYVDD